MKKEVNNIKFTNQIRSNKSIRPI